MCWNLRGEDDGLSDHLAALRVGDIDGVGSSARSTAHERSIGVSSPATVADVGLWCLVGVSVGGVTS